MKPAIKFQRMGNSQKCFLQFPLLLLLAFLNLPAQGQRPETNHFADLRLNEVNTHAARHCMAHFSPTTPVRWFQDEQHYVAVFKEGDSTDRVYYKLNGNFDGCVKYFGPGALEGNLKSSLLRKFPGCEILTVTEFSNLEKQELYIKIKDRSYIKTLHYSDEGTEITENIKDSGS